MIKSLLQKLEFKTETSLLFKLLQKTDTYKLDKKSARYILSRYYPEDDDDQPEAVGLIHMLICKMVLSQYVKV